MPSSPQWDGDRLTLDMPNQAIVMSRGVYGYYLRHPGREHH